MPSGQAFAHPSLQPHQSIAHSEARYTLLLRYSSVGKGASPATLYFVGLTPLASSIHPSCFYILGIALPSSLIRRAPKHLLACAKKCHAISSPHKESLTTSAGVISSQLCLKLPLSSRMTVRAGLALRHIRTSSPSANKPDRTLPPLARLLLTSFHFLGNSLLFGNSSGNSLY